MPCRGMPLGPKPKPLKPKPAVQGDASGLSRAVRQSPGSIDAIEPFAQHSALHLAVKQQHVQCAKLLLEAGARVNDKHAMSQETPLVTAVLLNNEGLVAVLLQYGAAAGEHLGKFKMK